MLDDVQSRQVGDHEAQRGLRIASATSICGIMKHVPITDKGIVTVGLPALKVAGECLATEPKNEDVLLKLLEILGLLRRIEDETGWQTKHWRIILGRIWSTPSAQFAPTSIYWHGPEATAIARSKQGQLTKGGVSDWRAEAKLNAVSAA